MKREHRTGAALGATGLGALLLITGCGDTATGGSPEQAAPTEAEETPHGYVEGAEETAEPQSRLVVADTGTGDVRVLDLLTEEVTELDPVPEVDAISGDGRFAYLQSSDHGSTDVVDSGAWTVDHGDHSHYYRTGIAHVGTLDATTSGAVTDTAVTSLLDGHGSTTTLDRSALESGEVEPVTAVSGDAATVLPYAGRLVVAEGGSDGQVRVLDREGAPVEVLDETCTDPAGAAVTRRGLVLGCAEGTLHVREDDDALEAETVPYPGDGGARTESFHHRPGSAVLAAIATDGDVWVLDLAEPAWTRLDVPDAVAVGAVGEDTFVLVLTADGTLRSLDPATGEEQAATALLDEVGEDPAPTIQIDTSRAYVNDAEAGLIHEIDYNDDLRLARTFDAGIAPHLMVETGR
ncbi:hypothetical protein DFP74_3765 [Nocardiopsis sp. Huas11]|uniref:ABC transporter n=1 Tax=Nocardiopsis sp. Huas11 TaxID=2183912 RepID=UPI000EAD516E|nr:ABC transporter [Nocardiopsis sp. Huas11]RKS08076.1 hypothetical protein DFP74_3765 [Nocardiopsis sp. Huas11]